LLANWPNALSAVIKAINDVVGLSLTGSALARFSLIATSFPHAIKDT
jgi:hypothetical protein